MTPTTPPRLLLVPTVGAVLLVGVPVVALLARTPWSRLAELLGSDLVTEALRLSLVTSVTATLLAAVLGLPAAVVLARAPLPGRRLVRAVLLLPLVLPPVVGGTALLAAFGRRGVLGGPLEAATGLVLPFSTAGVVLATTFVAMPLLVVTVEGALRGLDGRSEAAAATLGARPWRVLATVTLPRVRGALLAGLLLTWARALGEFGATLAFAGSLPGRTRTLPLAVLVALESDRDAALVLALVLVVVAVAVGALLRTRVAGGAAA